MEEHVKIKKSLGDSDRSLGPPRHPRPDRRLRPLLVGTHRDPGRSLRGLAGHH
jgi:hypothetical protein